MSITAELEKLISLRDQGDLSQAEFEKAKALLLSGEEEASSPPASPPATLAERDKKRKTQFLCAVLSTVAAALSICSAFLNPSVLKIVILLIWVTAAIFWWVSYSKLKSGIGASGQS